MSDKYLIGTDFTRQFQLQMTYELSLASGGKITQWIELQEHKIPMPPPRIIEKQSENPLCAIDEIEMVAEDE